MDPIEVRFRILHALYMKRLQGTPFMNFESLINEAGLEKLNKEFLRNEIVHLHRPRAEYGDSLKLINHRGSFSYFDIDEVKISEFGVDKYEEIINSTIKDLEQELDNDDIKNLVKSYRSKPSQFFKDIDKFDSKKLDVLNSLLSISASVFSVISKI